MQAPQVTQAPLVLMVRLVQRALTVLMVHPAQRVTLALKV